MLEEVSDYWGEQEGLIEACAGLTQLKRLGIKANRDYDVMDDSAFDAIARMPSLELFYLAGKPNDALIEEVKRLPDHIKVVVEKERDEPFQFEL